MSAARIVSVSDPVALVNAHGAFAMTSFEIEADGTRATHLAVTLGRPVDGDLVRVHSACVTGESLGCSRCSCAAQLDYAFAQIAAVGRGLITYHPPDEGRGLGLHAKVCAFAVADQATIDHDAALAHLGLPADVRTFTAAAAILRHFGLGRVRLLSANVAKRAALAGAGIVAELRPVSG